MNEKPKVPSLLQTRKVKACTEYCVTGARLTVSLNSRAEKTNRAIQRNSASSHSSYNDSIYSPSALSTAAELRTQVC